MFRKKRRRAAATTRSTASTTPRPTTVADHRGGDDGRGRRGAGRPAGASGPYDRPRSDDPADGGRVDLGGLWLPGRPGLEVRIEADQETGRGRRGDPRAGRAARCRCSRSPRRAARGSGTTCAPRSRAGSPSRAARPTRSTGRSAPSCAPGCRSRAADGTQTVQPARFLGVDGPRWFLRGVLTGKPAVQPGRTTGRWSRVFREIVVVRGDEAMAPRDLIPLRLPVAADGVPGRGAAGRGGLATTSRPEAVRARAGDHRDPLTSGGPSAATGLR